MFVFSCFNVFSVCITAGKLELFVNHTPTGNLPYLPLGGSEAKIVTQVCKGRKRSGDKLMKTKPKYREKGGRGTQRAPAGPQEYLRNQSSISSD